MSGARNVLSGTIGNQVNNDTTVEICSYAIDDERLAAQRLALDCNDIDNDAKLREQAVERALELCRQRVS